MLEEVSETGMLWPLLVIFLTQLPFFNFCKKMKKNENKICPLPYEEVLEASLRPFGQNNVGITKNLDTRGRLH